MEKTRFKTYLSESVNDTGIFKALFMGGIPGAGKSYTVDKITDGAIQPRIVNTDKMMQFLSKRDGVALDKEFTKDDGYRAMVDTSKHLTKSQLTQYLNGMLPLIADGTSNSISNILRRVGQLESVGYDTGMVWINTSLESSIARAEKRDRHVDPDFIKKMHDICAENRDFYKTKFDWFLEIDNEDGQLTDSVIKTAYAHANKFFRAPIGNPVGKRRLARLREAGEKYLIPTVYDANDLDNVVSSWYFSQ